MVIMISKGKDILNFSLYNISEFDILQYYLHTTRLPILMCSPFRNDTKPSLGITSKDGFSIFYKDFSTGETGSLLKFLSKLWNMSEKDTFNKICKELKYSTGNKISIQTEYKNKTYNSKLQLEVSTRDFEKHDIEFWNQFGINKEWLVFGNIYPITHIFLTRELSKSIISADKYAYCFVEKKDENSTMKIYQPYNSKYKWMNNHDSSVWDLWNHLPETGEHLIITSSRKDALCIWANTGIPSCSLLCESTIPKVKVVNILKKRFTNIYILYDNDFTKEINYGREYGKKLADKFNLIQIEIPIELCSKDPSDLFKNHGRKTFKKTIFNLIKNN